MTLEDIAKTEISDEVAELILKYFNSYEIEKVDKEIFIRDLKKILEAIERLEYV